MIGNFRLANKFATRLSKNVYENVFFDRFNSVHKGFYLLIGQENLAEMISKNSGVNFIKIPSTERFGSQDIIELEFHDPKLLTLDQKKLIYLLNSLIENGCYQTVGE